MIVVSSKWMSQVHSLVPVTEQEEEVSESSCSTPSLSRRTPSSLPRIGCTWWTSISFTTELSWSVGGPWREVRRAGRGGAGGSGGGQRVRLCGDGARGRAVLFRWRSWREW